MKDFSCKNPADMYYNSIREKTDKLKADGGVLMHGPVMDKLILQENTEMLIRLYKKGKITKEAIADELKISLDDVEKLLSK